MKFRVSGFVNGPISVVVDADTQLDAEIKCSSVPLSHFTALELADLDFEIDTVEEILK